MGDSPERLATTTRIVIRVVVRGMPLPEGGQFKVGELGVLIVARAKPMDWPDAELAKGDLEGVVWVRPEEAFDAAAELQRDARIIAVRLDLSA